MLYIIISKHVAIWMIPKIPSCHDTKSYRKTIPVHALYNTLPMRFRQYVVYTTSLTPPLFIEVPVPSQESEQSCIEVPVPSKESEQSCIEVPVPSPPFKVRWYQMGPIRNQICEFKRLRSTSTFAKCLTNTILGLQNWGQGRFQHNPELCCGLRILFVRFSVVVLGGVVFRFPNNLEKYQNKSFRKSYFLTFWWNLHWCFIMEQEVYWF